MGSYATGIDEDVAVLFAGAFAKLPQKVIWKLNGKPSATLTPNVKVVDWIPQNDLLGKLTSLTKRASHGAALVE